MEVIRNRIDKYGVAEPVIHRQGLGSNKIVVELPGVEDSTEIKALIGKAAQLEWHIAVNPKQGAPSRDAILKEYGGNLPPDVAIYPGSRDKYGSEIYFALKTVAPVTGADLQEVRVEANEYGQPAVGFILTATAGQRFRELTRTHLKEPLAIVLDGNVISSPVINAEIGDRGIIEGNFTTQEAQELVFQLKSGALPAIPRFAEERTVGPSMGLDSIRKGTISGLIGLVAILAFMLLYYRASGINANFCLLLNLVMLIGVMSTFGLTLTVPGIAGIILTLGMSIDANVLIFERIKDELIENKTVQTAITSGFGKAFITIFDSNVTTLDLGALPPPVRDGPRPRVCHHPHGGPAGLHVLGHLRVAPHLRHRHGPQEPGRQAPHGSLHRPRALLPRPEDSLHEVQGSLHTSFRDSHRRRHVEPGHPRSQHGHRLPRGPGAPGPVQPRR